MFRLRALAVAGLAATLLAGCGAGSTPSAATVNGQAVPLAQYTAEFHVERAAALDQYGYDVCALKGMHAACAQIKQNALNTLINDVLVHEYADRHHISVSSAQVAANWKSVYHSRFGSNPAVLKLFLKRMGESESDLRRSLADSLLEQKVLYAVTAGLPATVPAVRLAHLVATAGHELSQVRKLFQAHTPFMSIVRYLTHTSQKGCSQAEQQCGELGWVPDVLVPTNRKAVTTTPVGGVAGPFIEQHNGTTQWDYYLVEGRNPHYKMTTKQDFTRRQIVFNGWLTKQRAQAKVKQYIAI